MSELKPCPFCGGEAAGVIYHNEECTYIRHYVRCRRCDARTGKHKTYEFAENAWNRRADNDRQKAEIENYSHNNRTMTNSIYEMQKIIESQKAEIERLEKQLIFEIETAYDRGRKTASKEFAERLEDKLGNTDLAIHFVDNLVKEKVGDTG